MEDTSNSPLQRVAFIGGYLPRQCGIATFMTDLCEALAAQFQAINVLAIPVNDTVNGYSYPPRVRFELQSIAITIVLLAAFALGLVGVFFVTFMGRSILAPIRASVRLHATP